MTATDARAEARKLWNAAMVLSALSYDREAEADRIEGDELSAEFHASLAACYRGEPGCEERKERAYAAIKARDAQRLEVGRTPA